MPPTTHSPTTTDAARTLIAAVDAPRDDIDAVLRQGWQESTPADLGTLVEDIVDDALHDRSGADATTLPVEDPVTFTLGVALAAVRVERSTPFQAGPDQYHRRTTVSVETPLQANPGSSALFQRLRAHYQRGLTALYDESDDVTRFVARVVLSPAETTAPVLGNTTDAPLEQVALLTVDGTDYVQVPASAATQWCRIAPEQAAAELPSLKRRGETVLVPVRLVRAKFNKYAKYSFERVVHRAFHAIRDWRYARLKAESWRVEKQINDTYVRNAVRRLYGDRRYDTSSTTTPFGTQQTGFTPVAHHRQLVTIVDVLRASDLSFGAYHTAKEIHERAREYFPPPHRPSNTLWSARRVAQVLRSAAESDSGTNAVVECRNRAANGQTVNEYRIVEPRPTPLYTVPEDANGRHRWDAYRRVRARHAAVSLPAETALAVGTRQAAGTADDPLVAATQATHRFAATHPHERPLEAIGPAVHPDDLQLDDYDVTLTADDITYLTRVVAGLNGLIADETLQDGMGHYTRTADGHLDVDPEQLVEADLLETHDAPYQTIYTVQEDVVDALGLEYVTHEGYADETSAEKGEHKYGAVLLGAAIAARDEVDTVIRYVRLWRFDLDVDEETLQAQLDRDGKDVTVTDLGQRRLDVVGLNSDGTPVCAGEVQLDHDKRPRVRHNWEKLRYVGEAGATAIWLMPDLDDLASIVADLRKEDCLEAGPLPGTERVAHWQSFFDSNDLYNPGIAKFSTFRSLARGEVTL